MSWLLATRAEGSGGPPVAKSSKKEESKEAGMRKLVFQLESRIRTLEYASATQIFLQKDHALVEVGVTSYKKYIELVELEGQGHGRGPPDPQVFSSLLKDIDNFLSQEGSPAEVRKYQGIGNRLLAMMEKGTAEDASMWIKECAFSPTFDSKVLRLTVCLRGHILVARNVAAAEGLNKLQADAWGGAPTDEAWEKVLQRSPMELPITDTHKMVDLMAVVMQILRAWGGSRKLGRAPRGALAKGLGTK